MFFIHKMNYVLWLKLQRLVVMVPVTYRIFCGLSEAQPKHSAGTYMFKVNKRNIRTRWKYAQS